MDDGVLDAREETRLKEIAAAVNLSVAEFTRKFFHTTGERFLRGIFSACVADQHLSDEEWQQLIATTRKLGVSHDELLRAIQPQARQFVEHVLADAKADGRLSKYEEQTLNWLLGNLGLPADHRAYIMGEVAVLRKLTQIVVGKLPSEPVPPGVAVRSGEIVHFHGPCTWRQPRQRQGRLVAEDHDGTITLTDHRMIFSSSTKSQLVNYRKIVAYRDTRDWIEVQLDGKPVYTFFIHGNSPIPSAIFRSALAMANQRLIAKVEGGPSRHIPRDVRPRVWQRYGGRCAECNADDYLEFDHIVPVARGGSNSDNNVQLLCRRCNLRKSAQI